jgi:hypothetical protein
MDDEASNREQPDRSGNDDQKPEKPPDGTKPASSDGVWIRASSQPRNEADDR